MLIIFKSSMNIKLLYILWKSVLSQIIWYHFCVVCVHAWMNRWHCLRSAKVDLGQSDAFSMYYVGISGVRVWIKSIKWNALHIFLAKGKVTHTYTHTYTHTHKCSFIFYIRYLICVAWLILLGVLFGSAKTESIPKSQLFYSNTT